MEKLIKAYLKHIGHYIEGDDVNVCRTEIQDDEKVYIIKIDNQFPIRKFTEYATVSSSDLLVFLFERQA